MRQDTDLGERLASLPAPPPFPSDQRTFTRRPVPAGFSSSIQLPSSFNTMTVTFVPHEHQSARQLWAEDFRADREDRHGQLRLRARGTSFACLREVHEYAQPAIMRLA